MYKVVRDGNTTTLVKIRKDGVEVEKARTIETVDGRLLIFSKYVLNTFTFKSLSDIKLKLVGSQYIASVKHDIDIYIRPHYQELHNVIMTESRNRYSFSNARYRQGLATDNIELDDRAILDNMLEFVGRI